MTQLEMHCYCMVVLWEAALHNEAQMKSVFTKSLENPFDLTAQRWTHNISDWRCSATGLAVSPAAAICLSYYSLLSQDLAVFCSVHIISSTSLCVHIRVSW